MLVSYIWNGHFWNLNQTRNSCANSPCQLSLSGPLKVHRTQKAFLLLEKMVLRDVSIAQYSVIVSEIEQVLPSFNFSNTGNICVDSHCQTLLCFGKPKVSLLLLEKRKP